MTQTGRAGGKGDRRGLDACGMHSIFIFHVIFPIMGSTAECSEHSFKGQ